MIPGDCRSGRYCNLSASHLSVPLACLWYSGTDDRLGRCDLFSRRRLLWDVKKGPAPRRHQMSDLVAEVEDFGHLDAINRVVGPGCRCHGRGDWVGLHQGQTADGKELHAVVDQKHA